LTGSAYIRSLFRRKKREWPRDTFSHKKLFQD
jgi:hypothetical protein